MTRDILYSYMNERHTPQNMVIAGVGVAHETLVEQAQKYFAENTPLWLPHGQKWGAGEPATKCVSQYTGGHVLVNYEN